VISWAEILVGVAAVVGAGAWIPHILKWIAKPKLEVLSAPGLIIFYHVGGVAIQWPISIAVERQDALIMKAELLVTHQNGDSRKLFWGGIEEEFIQITIPEMAGNPLKYTKPSQVFAVKAVTQSLTERIIRFHDEDFYLTGLDKTESLREYFTYLKEQDASAAESITTSREFKQTLEFYNKDLFWKEGIYDLILRLKIRGLKSLHEQKFKFTLSKEDTITLQENRNQFEPYLQNLLTGSKQVVNWRHVFVNVSPTR